jgi:hypothetical protein
MAGKKIKLEEKASGEILVSDIGLKIKKCFLTRESQKQVVASEITQFSCHLCSSRGQRKCTMYKCARCDAMTRVYCLV